MFPEFYLQFQQNTISKINVFFTCLMLISFPLGLPSAKEISKTDQINWFYLFPFNNAYEKPEHISSKPLNESNANPNNSLWVTQLYYNIIK